jgi:hypothetical protein
MSYLILIAPLVILLFLPLTVLMLSRLGWTALAAKYRSNDVIAGTRVGMISAAVNTANYKNSLVLKYNDEGMYLRPVFVFRLFHPPVFIPWREIVEVNEKSVLRGETRELVVGEPEVARITVLETTFRTLEASLGAARQRGGSV